jgi:outer membrane immunogenic protein
LLRVECLRCFRIVEIQKADAVRLYGPHAVYKDVGQALLNNGCTGPDPTRTMVVGRIGRGDPKKGRNPDINVSNLLPANQKGGSWNLIKFLSMGIGAMRKILTAIVLVISAGTASAADMPNAAPYQKAPVVSPAYNWTGFYIGAMGGYGWSDRVTIAGVTVTNADLKGGFGGGTVGFNYQAPGSMFVVGVEADAAWSDIQRSETLFGITAQERIQSFGSVTGRAGVAVDTVLLYGKGGYAWADNKISASALGLTFSETRFHSGWTVGGGGEWAFAGPWSAKAEYMFARYNSERYLAALVPPGVALAADVHTVKAGINYRFGWGGPVVAKY